VHELSIALGIVEAATEELERHGGTRVRSVHVRVGPLSGVAADALRSAYPLASQGSALEGSELIIRSEPVTGHCPRCATEVPARSPAELACAWCGEPMESVLQGRALEVVAMEIDG
jgi:hydrogenase nickel incorporation protein HypA/HybF